MGPYHFDVPFVGDISVAFPSDTRGRTFFDAERCGYGAGFRVWAGALHFSYDPPRHSPVWIVGALAFLLALLTPNVFTDTATDNAIREALGAPPKHPVSRTEFAQICREWPHLSMCRANTMSAGGVTGTVR